MKAAFQMGPGESNSYAGMEVHSLVDEIQVQAIQLTVQFFLATLYSDYDR